jgi:hypothetical protein
VNEVFVYEQYTAAKRMSIKAKAVPLHAMKALGEEEV